MKVLIFLITFCLSLKAYSYDNNYIINKITFYGLNSLSKERVLKSLNLKIITNEEDLFYKLVVFRFFDNIKVIQKKRHLYIFVKEKPYIKNLHIEGDDEDGMPDILNDYKIIKGNLLDTGLLKLALTRIKELYHSKGYYNTEIKTKILTNKKNKSADVYITITKNNLLKINNLIIIGNKKYSYNNLLSIFSFSANKWKYIIKNNVYIKFQLVSDLKRLKDLYINNGYKDFQVNEIKIVLNKNYKTITVLLNIYEGEIYNIGNISIKNEEDEENHKLFKTLHKMINSNIKKNDIYSYKKITDTKKELYDYLIGINYPCLIIVNLEMKNNKKYVDIEYSFTFHDSAIIKKIYITGNYFTSDLVFRKFLQSWEMSDISLMKLNNAREEIIKNGYAKEIDATFNKISDIRLNEVDVTLKIEEQRINKFLAGFSYGTKEGVAVNMQTESLNILGSGNDIAFSFTQNENLIDYNIGIFSPNLLKNTEDLNYNIYYRVDLENESFLHDFQTNSYGFVVNYIFNKKKETKINITFGGDDTYVAITGLVFLPYLKKFVDTYGNRYKEYFFLIGYTYNTTNKTLFPSNGIINKSSLKFTLPIISTVKYFIINNEINLYEELSKDYILNVYINFSFGQKYGDTVCFPFYRNFIFKGKTCVRGYSSKTLGPKILDQPLSIGGNLLINIKTSIYFPIPFIEDNETIKPSIFFDCGQIYDSTTDYSDRPITIPFFIPHNSFLKISCGLSLEWSTPLGVPIEMSIAYPFNPGEFDKKEIFSITVGLNNDKI